MRINRRNLSRATKNDPALMRRTMKAYENALAALFKRFRSRVQVAVEQKRNLSDGSTLRALGQAEDLKKTIQAMIQADILTPGKSKTDLFTEKSYKQGEVRATQFLTAIGIKAQISTMPFNPDALEILRDRNFSALEGITDAMSNDISRELTDGMTKGEGPDVLARRIVASVDDIGMDRAKMMARTESMYSFNTAAKEQYARYGVTEGEWLASGLENMCDYCKDIMDGKRFPLESAPACPAHPNCECTILPVVD